MDKILATLLSWAIGAPLYMPWVLARTGNYKSWYLTHLAPPFLGGRLIYAWPISAMFLVTPIIAIVPLNPDDKLKLRAIVATIGMILAIFMVIWTPNWAKPEWQQFLEKNYSFKEIRVVFVPAWREMDRGRWSYLLDSEEGIQELVQYARDYWKKERSTC